MTPSPVVVMASPTPDGIGGGGLRVVDLKAVPNPGARSIAVLLSGRCDRLILKLWTPNLVLVGQTESGPWPAGWASLQLPQGSHPTGLYYATVSAEQGARHATPARPLRLILLR